MDDNFGCLAAVAVVVAVLLFAVGIPMALFYSDRAECGYIQVNAGAQTKFVKNHIYSWDCFVLVDGQWIPSDRWRGDSEGGQ